MKDVQGALALVAAISPQFRLYDLAGKRHRAYRQAILTRLLGQRPTLAEAGYTALRKAFYAEASIAPGSEAAQEVSFMDWAEALYMPQNPA